MENSIAILGTGWGAFLARTIRKLDSRRDLYLFGRCPGRTSRLAAKIGATGVFASLDAVLTEKRVSALVVALPHCLHSRVAIRAAKVSKNIFVEKPIARSCEEGRAILQAARVAGSVLHVGENIPFRPDLRKARTLILEGRIGTPVHMLCFGMHHMAVRGWRANRAQMGEGILTDFGVHHIRAIRMLMGEPTRAECIAGPKLITTMEGVDSATLALHGDGWTAESRLSWGLDAGGLPEFVVMGTEGTLHIWAGKSQLDLYSHRARGARAFVQRVLPAALYSRLYPGKPIERFRLPRRDALGYEDELKAFMEALDTGSSSYEGAEQAIADLEVLEAASRKTGIQFGRCSETTSVDGCIRRCAAMERAAAAGR